MSIVNAGAIHTSTLLSMCQFEMYNYQFVSTFYTHGMKNANYQSNFIFYFFWKWKRKLAVHCEQILHLWWTFLSPVFSSLLGLYMYRITGTNRIIQYIKLIGVSKIKNPKSGDVTQVYWQICLNSDCFHYLGWECYTQIT